MWYCLRVNIFSSFWIYTKVASALEKVVVVAETVVYILSLQVDSIQLQVKARILETDFQDRQVYSTLKTDILQIYNTNFPTFAFVPNNENIGFVWD